MPRQDDQDLGNGERSGIRVSELFESFQGEGPSAGQHAVFLRLAGCNLSCAWCDTRHSWDWHTTNREIATELYNASDLASRIARLAGSGERLLIVTGGEPLLQDQVLIELLTALRVKRPQMRVEMETNGTLRPSEPLAVLIHRFVVSPKLSHAGGSRETRVNVDALENLAALPTTAFKFVVRDQRDISEVEAARRELHLETHRIWLMPLANTQDAMAAGLRELANAALRNGYNLSGRYQLMWGDRDEWRVVGQGPNQRTSAE